VQWKNCSSTNGFVLTIKARTFQVTREIAALRLLVDFSIA